MASLFRPKRVHYQLANGKRVKKGTSGARKVRKRSEKWYALYLDANDEWKRKPLCADKTAAQTMLNDLLTQEDHKRAGRIDGFDEAMARPVAEHLADYKAHLQAKRNTEKHVALQMGRIESLCDACHFRRLTEIQASAVDTFLADARTIGIAIVDAAGKPVADVDGNPKRRKIGVATSNHHLAAIRSFTRWLVRDRRLPSDPLSHLSRLNPKADVKRERRPLEPDEFAAFIAAARANKPFRGLSGESRVLLYLVAANTGLRASELASLTVASFDLDAKPATVTVEAAYSKHRRRDVLPLRADLVDLLCPFLATFNSEASSVPHNGRSTHGDPEAESSVESDTTPRLWAGTWVERSARMLRRDLTAARDKWLKDAETDAAERKRRERTKWLCYRDEAGRVFDFHALRHQFISNLARGRVHVKEAQQLARHSTITLTMDCYTHLGIVDLTSALDVLPALPTIDGPATEAAELRATGTDGRANRKSLRAQGRAQKSDLSCPVVSLSDHESDRGRDRETMKKPARNAGFVGKESSSGAGTRTPDTRIMIPLL
jgi:integrase